MGARQVAPGQLFHLAHPVAERVAVAVDLAGRPLPLAVLLDEGLQRSQQLAAVLRVAALDRAEHAVAVEVERVVVLNREQQGEGAEVAPGGDLRGGPVLEGGRLEGAARLVEGVTQALRQRRAAGGGADAAAVATSIGSRSAQSITAQSSSRPPVL